MSRKHTITRPGCHSRRRRVEDHGMSGTKWKIAAAFTIAADALRLSHRERAIILEKASGLEGLTEELRTMKDHSPQSGELYNLFMIELSRTPRSLPNYSVDAVTIADSEYPQRLCHMDQPPSILFCRGHGIAALHAPFVMTVVGTRNPSFYGLEVTKKLCREMVQRGITIVSGGARGIDRQAHAAALSGGSGTIAVLGCGVDIAYPKEHASLFDEIAQSGALVSEYPPGTLPRKYHFPARNRILAGLCDAVLVTEASRFSGTLITAGFAADYGRDVCAVPGSILSGTSRSCHDLIREGAVIVESIDDIPRIPPHPTYSFSAVQSDRSQSPSGVMDCEGGHNHRDEECILNFLAAAPRTLRAVSEHCRLDLRSSALMLANMQAKGIVRLYRGLYVRSSVGS